MSELPPRTMSETVSATEFPVEILFPGAPGPPPASAASTVPGNLPKFITMHNRTLLLTRYRYNFSGSPFSNYDVEPLSGKVHWLQ